MLRKSPFLLIVLMISLSVIPAVQADAPPSGTVYEGLSVPGIAIGDTRAEVEASIGPPRSCNSVEEIADYASCSFYIQDGGLVWVRYRGPDGGNASNSPDDLVRHIRWSGTDTWVTTAGVYESLALNDPQAVIDAYPNAEVIYNVFDQIYQVSDPELGINVTWNYNFYGNFTTVAMSIFAPYTPPPPPDMIRVAEIEMTTDRHSVTARVLVVDDQDRPVEGALVEAAWSYPKVSNLPVSGETDTGGYTTFRVDKARRGTYYLSISNITLDGYVYDFINSVTLGVIPKT